DMPSQQKKEQLKLEDFDLVDLEIITDRIVKLEEEMKDAAQKLEFERAAQIRDHIKELKAKIEDT
ncbi:MAG: UvrB/UvrC motif-containing protein, partial [Promethearchaeati archaeon]